MKTIAKRWRSDGTTLEPRGDLKGKKFKRRRNGKIIIYLGFAGNSPKKDTRMKALKLMSGTVRMLSRLNMDGLVIVIPQPSSSRSAVSKTKFNLRLNRILSSVTIAVQYLYSKTFSLTHTQINRQRRIYGSALSVDCCFLETL